MKYTDQHVTGDQLEFGELPPTSAKEPPLCTKSFATGIAVYATVYYIVLHIRLNKLCDTCATISLV